MERWSSAPIQSNTSGSNVSESSSGSLPLSSSRELEVRSSLKTGLVNSLNGKAQRRSYGTVNQLSSFFKRSGTSVVNHLLEEGDTLQGLALRYNVLVSVYIVFCSVLCIAVLIFLCRFV